MSTSSFSFQFPQNRAGMPVNGAYNTPSISYSPALSADHSFSSGTFGSGPSTPADGSLLSPAPISYSAASGGLGSIDSSAYMQLKHQNECLQRELSKERQDHASLQLLFQKLLDSNNQLSAALTTSTKRPLPDDSDVDLPTGHTQTQTNRATLPALSRSDSPLVKFWTREEWNAYNTARKDSSSAEIDNPRCGPTDFIEEADGTPVCATMITDIRHFARTIWIGAFERGKAPKTWGGASKELRDEYFYEMESHWGVLRYCQNHWKADLLATLGYSPWYRHHSSKANKEEPKLSKERAAKRSKTAVNNVNLDHASEPEPQAGPSGTPTLENLAHDFDDALSGPSLPVEQGIQKTGDKTTSRPRARRVTRKDPLAGVFDNASAMTFSILDVVPASISLERPADASHGNMDDSDVEPDTIAPTPPPAESPGRREPTEPTVVPPVASPTVRVPLSKQNEMKARRLANKAERRRRMEELGLPPSDDEGCPTYHPTEERIRELKEKRRARLEQERLEQEREAKELEAMERELMEHEARERETQATSEATSSGKRAPQAPVAECPPLDNTQLSACSDWRGYG